MSADIADLAIRVSDIDIVKTTKSLDRMGDAADRVSTKGKKSGDNIDKSMRAAGVGISDANKSLKGFMSSFGGLGTLIGGIGLTGLAIGIGDYTGALAEVSTLVDTTKFSMDDLSDSVVAQAKQFGSMPTQTAAAFYDAVSAGAATVEQANDAMTASNKLAIGGVTDIGTAVDGLTSSMNAYGGEAGTFTDISDSMFTAVKAGKTTIGELSASIGAVAPLAAQAGVKFDELTAGAAALTKGGQSTSTAMNGLRAIVAGVVKPTKEAADLAAELGIEFNAAGLESRGLAGFLQHVAEKTGGSTEKMSQLFGGVEALTPALALTGAASADFADILAQMESKAGATDEAFTKMANSPGFQMKRIISGLTAEFLSLGGSMANKLVPALKFVADGITPASDALKAFAGFIAPVIPYVASFTAVLVASKAGAVALSVLAGGFTAVGVAIKAALAIAAANPLTIAVATLAAGATLIYNNWDKFPKWWKDIWAGVGEVVDKVSDALNGFATWWNSKIDGLADGAKEFAAKWIGAYVKTVVQLKGKAVDAAVDIAKGVAEGFKSILTDGAMVADWIGSIATDLKNGTRELVAAAKTMGGKLIDALIDAIKAKAKALPKLMADIVKGSLPSINLTPWRKKGQELPEAIGAGVEANDNAVADATGKVMDKALVPDRSLLRRAEEAGKNFTGAVASGAGKALDVVSDAGEKVGSMLSGATESFLEIFSPSRVGERIGQFYSLGIAAGVVKEQAAVEKAATDVAKIAVASTDLVLKSIDSQFDKFSDTAEAMGEYAHEFKSVASQVSEYKLAITGANAESVKTASILSGTTREAGKAELKITGLNKTTKAYTDRMVAANEANAEFFTGMVDAVKDSSSFKGALDDIKTYAGNWLKDMGADFLKDKIRVFFDTKPNGAGSLSSITDMASGFWSKLSGMFRKEGDALSSQMGTLFGGGGGNSGIGGAVSSLGGLFDKFGAKASSMFSGLTSKVGAFASSLSSLAGPLAAAYSVGDIVGDALGTGNVMDRGGIVGTGLFGGKTKQTGGHFSFDFDGDAIVGQWNKEFEKVKSFFRGTKRWVEAEDLGAEFQTQITEAFDTASGSIVSNAEALGVTASDEITNSFMAAAATVRGSNFETTLSDGIKAGTDKAFRTAYNELDTELKPLVYRFARSMADGPIDAFNHLEPAFERFGQVAGEVLPKIEAMGLNLGESFAGALDNGNLLVEAMGGIEAFSGKTALFFNEFYSEAERGEIIAKQAATTIADFNSQLSSSALEYDKNRNGLIDTKEELRAYTESLDLTTAAGRDAFAAAMDVAGSFVAMDESGKTLSEALGGMPDTIQGVATSASILNQVLPETVDTAVANTLERADQIKGIAGIVENMVADADVKANAIEVVATHVDNAVTAAVEQAEGMGQLQTVIGDAIADGLVTADEMKGIESIVKRVAENSVREADALNGITTTVNSAFGQSVQNASGINQVATVVGNAIRQTNSNASAISNLPAVVGSVMRNVGNQAANGLRVVDSNVSAAVRQGQQAAYAAQLSYQQRVHAQGAANAATVDASRARNSANLANYYQTVAQNAYRRIETRNSGEGSFAMGNPRVARDMLANIHKDEIVMPAATSNFLRDAGIPIVHQDSTAERPSDRDALTGEILSELKRLSESANQGNNDRSEMHTDNARLMAYLISVAEKQGESLEEIETTNDTLLRKIATG